MRTVETDHRLTRCYIVGFLMSRLIFSYPPTNIVLAPSVLSVGPHFCPSGTISQYLSVILLPAHPEFCLWDAKFLFQRVPGCNSIADLSLKVVFLTHKFQLDSLTWETASPRTHKPKIVNESLPIGQI